MNSDLGDFELGVKDGLIWAEDTNYRDLRAVVKSSSIPDSIRGDETSDPGNYGYFDEMYKSLKDNAIDVAHWEKGWIEGVKMFWNDLKEYLE